MDLPRSDELYGWGGSIVFNEKKILSESGGTGRGSNEWACKKENTFALKDYDT